MGMGGSPRVMVSFAHHTRQFQPVILRCEWRRHLPAPEPRRMRPGSRRGGILLRAPRLSRPPLCVVLNGIPVAPSERLFLGAAPTLHLALYCDRVSDAIEMLGPHKSHRTARRRVSRIIPRIVRRDALCEIVPGRRADVVRAISAQENVYERAHWQWSRSKRHVRGRRPSRRGRRQVPAPSHLRMTVSKLARGAAPTVLAPPPPFKLHFVWLHFHLKVNERLDLRSPLPQAGERTGLAGTYALGEGA